MLNHEPSRLFRHLPLACSMKGIHAMTDQELETAMGAREWGRMAIFNADGIRYTTVWQ